MTGLITLGKQGQQSAFFLSNATTKQKNGALTHIIQAIHEQIPFILEANQRDICQATEMNVPEAMLDRLLLNEERLYAMTRDIQTIIDLPDPIGRVDSMWRNEQDLLIGKQRVPLGVIGIIYEARPNVTTDAASLCLKSGNAVILRGGKEAFQSNMTLVKAMQIGLKRADFPKSCIQFIEDTSRETATQFMQLNGYLDVLIPRGGAQLIQATVRQATVPVIETGTGNCHVYVDVSSELSMAKDIVINGKCQRPSVCNATETLLIHRDIAPSFLALLEPELLQHQVEIRAEQDAFPYLSSPVLATVEDYATEFNDYILAIKLVDSLEEAIQHINQYGTGHSEVIVTNDYTSSQQFLQQVDAAAVYVNASSRFTDGSMFGFGGEIGISTQKMHARGPMGLNELTTTKYIIQGNGQIRS